MASNENIVKTVVDIGNGYIKAILGEMSSDGKWLRVIKYAEVASIGIKKSNIENTIELSSALGTALDKLKATGYMIDKITIGIGGQNVKTKRATIVYDFDEKEITNEEIKVFYRKAENEMLTVDEKLIHREMYNIKVNNSGIVKRAQGIVGNQIKADVYMVYMEEAELERYEDVVNKSGAEIERIIYAPFAASRALLTSQEKQKGVILIDIGEGSTDITLFKYNRLIYTASIPVGGMHYVNDLALTLYNASNTRDLNNRGINNRDAAEVLDKYLKKEISTDNKIYVKDKVTCFEKDVKAVINARTVDIARMIKEVLKNTGYAGFIEKGIVLTGGATIVDGLLEKINEKTG